MENKFGIVSSGLINTGVVPVKVMKTADNARVPEYKTEGSVGADLYSIEPVVLSPGQSELVSTGLCFEIPIGYEIQIRPRSGLALKYGITVLNAPGTIDSDYRGVLGVILINLGGNVVTLPSSSRIAQMVVKKVDRAGFRLVDTLSETERGSGGFGSTGVN